MRSVAFAVLLALGFGLAQWMMGAYRSDLGGDPDEAAHAVTALMVRDYLWHGGGESPLHFAERYYETFPKVALGHYPPGYYIPGALMLSLWCDPRALLVLQLLLAVSAGLLTRWIWCRWTDDRGATGWIVALMVVMHPEVIRVGCHVLSDLQVMLLTLAAVAAWIAYLKQPSWKSSQLFGAVTTAAILTKGSAMGLVGLPMLSVMLAGRWSLLRRLDFWLCGLPVMLVAGPWMMFSVRFTQEGFMAESPSAFFVQACSYYAEAIPRVYGWPLVVGMMASLGRLLWLAVRHRPEREFRATLWAAWISMQALIMVVPTGFSPRYLVPGLPWIVLLVALELRDLLGKRSSFVAPLLLFLLTETTTWRREPKLVKGFSTLVEEKLARTGQHGVWLVAADPRGEGAVIAAAAFGLDGESRVRGDLRVLRGSKVIAETDWLGQRYETKFDSAGLLRAELDHLGVDWVLVDESMPEAQRKPHETFLKDALEGKASGWQPGVLHPVFRRMEASGVVWSFDRVQPTP